MNSITSMHRDVSFIPAGSCGSSSGSTELPLPAHLAFMALTWHLLYSPGIPVPALAFIVLTWHSHCATLSFIVLTWYLCCASSGIYCTYLAFLVPALPQKAFDCQYGKKIWPKNQQHNWSKLGISRTASLSLDLICSWMSFSAGRRKVMPLKLLQPLQDSSFPLGITTGACTLAGYYVFIDLMMSHSGIGAGWCYECCLLNAAFWAAQHHRLAVTLPLDKSWASLTISFFFFLHCWSTVCICLERKIRKDQTYNKPSQNEIEIHKM